MDRKMGKLWFKVNRKMSGLIPGTWLAKAIWEREVSVYRKLRRGRPDSSTLILDQLLFVFFLKTLILPLALWTRARDLFFYFLLERPDARPGETLLAVVTFLYSSKSVEEVFKPIVADMQFEVGAALKRGERWDACKIYLAHLYSFTQAAGLFTLVSFVLKVIYIFRLFK